MDYDRYGRIRIYSMFLPDFVTSSNGAEYYSDIKSIDEQSKKKAMPHTNKDTGLLMEKCYFCRKKESRILDM